MKDRFEDRLVAYLEGDLPERERRELDEHLESCQDCRQLASAGRMLDTLVKELPAPELPTGFMNRFGAALDAAQPARVVTLRPRRVVWSRTLLAAAACFLVLFGMLLLWSQPARVQSVVAAGPPVVLVASGAPLVNEQRIGKVVGLSENQVVVTDQKATSLVVGASSQVELAAGSELRVLKVERNLSSRRIEGELELLRGTAMVAESGARLAVRTPHGVIVPVGTSYEVALDGDATRVQVFSGSVRVERPSGGQDTLDAGWQGVLRNGKSLEKSPLQEVRQAPRRPAPVLGGNLDQGQDYPRARPRPQETPSSEGPGAPGPRPGMGDGPGPRPEMGDGPGPRPGMGDGQGPRPGMGDGPGPRPGMGEGPGPRPGMGEGPGPRPGMGDGPGPRPGMGEGPGPRPGMGDGPGPRPGMGDGQGPRPGMGEGPGGQRPRPGVNGGPRPGMDGGDYPRYRPRPNDGSGPGREGGNGPGYRPRGNSPGREGADGPPGYRSPPNDGNGPGRESDDGPPGYRARPNNGNDPGREGGDGPGYRPRPNNGNGPGREGGDSRGYRPRPNGNGPGGLHPESSNLPRPRFEGAHPAQRTPVIRRQAR